MAQIQKIEALDKVRERKRDTRRKILVGAYVLEKADAERTRDALYQQMEQYLKRNTDRELFQLTPIAEEKELKLTEAAEAI